MASGRIWSSRALIRLRSAAHGRNSLGKDVSVDLIKVQKSTEKGCKFPTSSILVTSGVILFSATQWVTAEVLRQDTSWSAGHTFVTESPAVERVGSFQTPGPDEVVSNSHTAKWRVFTDIARDLYTKGKLDGSQKYLELALEEAKKGFGERDSHVASSYNNLAELARIRRDFVKSESLFMEALQRLEEAMGPDHITVAFTLHNLGSTYLQQKKYTEAQPCFERALKIKKRILGPNHAEYATTMFSLGEVLRLQGKLEDAKSLIGDSIQILEDAGVGDSAVAIRRMGRLAKILCHTRNFEEAEILQKKILHVLELSQGVDAESTLAAAENLAETLHSLGRLTEAEETLQRCLDVRNKHLDPNNFQLGVLLLKLGTVLLRCGDDILSTKDEDGIADAKVKYDKAEEMLSRAVSIAESSWVEALSESSTLRQSSDSLIFRLSALDAMGSLEVSKMKIASSSQEVKTRAEGAEKSYQDCLALVNNLRSGKLLQLAAIPEVERQHTACGHHLLALLRLENINTDDIQELGSRFKLA